MITQLTRRALRSRSFLGCVAVGGFLIASAGTALAVYVVNVGLVGAAVPAGAAAFAAQIVINTNAPGAGGYGDTILAVEEGRDYTSPFAALTVEIANTNPGWATYAGVLPAPAAPAGFLPAPLRANFQTTFIYRSTNDPANPGWALFPAGAGQLDGAVESAHAVAEALSAHRAYVGTAPAGVLPWINIEFDAAAGANQNEFYKWRVIR